MQVYAKATVGALIAALSSIATALGDNNISGQEWVTAAIAFLVAFGAIWNIPYKAASK